MNFTDKNIQKTIVSAVKQYGTNDVLPAIDSLKKEFTEEKISFTEDFVISCKKEQKDYLFTQLYKNVISENILPAERTVKSV